MYKIAFIDLDGTLLNSQHQISDYDKEIVMQAAQKIKIVFASARGFYRIEDYIKQIGTLTPDNYTLAFNGSLLTNNTQELKLIDNSITSDNLDALLQWLYQQKPAEIYAYHYNGSNLLQPNQKVSDSIYKVVVLETPENVQMLRSIMPDYIKDNFEITSSEPIRIEFVQKGRTKRQAILTLLEHLNITPEEMIAIGDGENDISMLQLAGTGVAMDNAPEIVKLSANMTTASFNDSGVGKALKKLLQL